MPLAEMRRTGREDYLGKEMYKSQEVVLLPAKFRVLPLALTVTTQWSIL